jgi:hypothetical protein
MRRKTPLLLCLSLFPACADGPGDPQRDPPGHAVDGGSDDGSGDTHPSTETGEDDDGGVDASTGETTTDGSSSGAIEEMPCDDLCLPIAPSGWHGPAALIRSSSADAEPACGTSHPVALATLISDLVAPAAECDCYCDDAVGAECEAAIARVYDNPGCEGVADDSFDVGMGCTNNPTGQGWWKVEFAPPSGGECAPIESSTIGDVGFTRWTLCGAEPLAGECGADESCTPTPGGDFEESQCIWIEGDVACPSTEFTERTLVHGGVVDDRSCSECSCSAPSGVCDGGEVLLDIYENCDTSASLALWEATPGDCLGEVYFESATVQQTATPFAACDPTMPASLGSATLDQPFTVCCAA